MLINRFNFDEDPELFNSQSFLMLDDSPFLSYTKFRKKAFAGNFDEHRTKWLKEALHKHILKGYPYSHYNHHDSLEDYYDFLAGHIDPDASPQELIQEVIASLINHLDFDNYPRDPLYGYLKLNTIVLGSIATVGKLISSMNNELKTYFYLQTLQFILRLCNNRSPSATLYRRSFEYQVIRHLFRAVNESYQDGLYFKCLSENPILKKQLDEYGCLEEMNKAILKSALTSANYYYPGYHNSYYGPTIDTERAFKLYSEIPAWATVECAEAQFWMAKLICYHSNFTPENFETESINNKKKRLLAMKPHLAAAAENGNDLAKFEKKILDEKLDNVIRKKNKKRKLSIDKSKPQESSQILSLSINCFFKKESAQSDMKNNKEILSNRLKY
jgi:hypothetical protein